MPAGRVWELCLQGAAAGGDKNTAISRPLPPPAPSHRQADPDGPRRAPSSLHPASIQPPRSLPSGSRPLPGPKPLSLPETLGGGDAESRASVGGCGLPQFLCSAPGVWSWWDIFAWSCLTFGTSLAETDGNRGSGRDVFAGCCTSSFSSKKKNKK